MYVAIDLLQCEMWAMAASKDLQWEIKMSVWSEQQLSMRTLSSSVSGFFSFGLRHLSFMSWDTCQLNVTLV